MARPAVMTVADTIAKSFLLAVETRGDKTAIREKHLGVWQSTSWRQWLETSKEIAYALDAPGHVNLDLITMRPVAQSANHLLARGPLRVRTDD